jgi:hypothetical protein
MPAIHTLSDHVKVVPSVPPLLRDAASVNGLSIDMAGYDGLMAIYHVGVNDIESTFELEDSADDSSFADVDLPSTGVTIVTTAADETNECWIVNIRAQYLRRYVRVQHTGGNGTAGCNGSAVLIAYKGRTMPAVQPTSVTAVTVV